jgi:exosortase B
VLSIPATASLTLENYKRWLAWVPIAIGLAALYVPTFVGLARGLWTQDEHLHGPIVLAVVAWIGWQLRAGLVRGDDRPRAIAGCTLLFFGLLLYVLGRSQDIIIVEVGSLVPVAAAVLLAMRGPHTLARFWFPLLFIGFMLPLPGLFVDALTGPLKQHVSAIAEASLYSVGYPIARQGVVLNVGPYQLLVADACSGLHSLISMSAMGLLYIYLSRHDSAIRNAILVACLLPIAFAANVVRVMVLVLVTYHFGDAAGQGFIHDLSGAFLFIVGLLFLFVIDALCGRIVHRPDRDVVTK